MSLPRSSARAEPSNIARGISIAELHGMRIAWLLVVGAGTASADCPIAPVADVRGGFALDRASHVGDGKGIAPTAELEAGAWRSQDDRLTLRGAIGAYSYTYNPAGFDVTGDVSTQSIGARLRHDFAGDAYVGGGFGV